MAANDDNSEGKTAWVVIGGVVFLVVLMVLFMALANGHLMRRWRRGHFSGSLRDGGSTILRG